jgi:hypothetical protein
MDDEDDWVSELPPQDERVTDEEERRVVQLLLQDVRATLGPDHDDIVVSNARRLREFAPIDFDWRVVDDVQQEIHDVRIDTTWPASASNRRPPVAASTPLAALHRRGRPEAFDRST